MYVNLHLYSNQNCFYNLNILDDVKSAAEKSREIELLHQLRAVEEQRGKLLTSFQQDMRQ